MAMRRLLPGRGRFHGGGGMCLLVRAAHGAIRTRTVTALDILRTAEERRGHKLTDHIPETTTVAEAMRYMLEVRCGSLIVKNDRNHVVGFVTQRDLLRCVVNNSTPCTDPAAEPRNWNQPVKPIMTPSKDLIFLSPKDTLDDARALMSISGKRHIPVLSEGALIGIISPKDVRATSPSILFPSV